MVNKVTQVTTDLLRADANLARGIFAPRIVIHGSDTLYEVLRYMTGHWCGVQYLRWNHTLASDIGLDTQQVEGLISAQLLSAGAERFSCLEPLLFRNTGTGNGILSAALRGSFLRREKLRADMRLVAVTYPRAGHNEPLLAIGNM